MANPALGDLMDRARGVLNEASANAWPDTDMVLLGFLATGLQEAHALMKIKVGGGLPPDDSPYWRNFLASAVVTVATDTSEKELPADCDIVKSVIDAATNEALVPYAFRDEQMLKRGRKLGVVGGQGYYTYAPDLKLRVLVWPGSEGVPQANRDLTVWYYKMMPRYTAKVDVCILPDEFTDAAVNFGIAKGLARFRDSPVEFFQAFRASVESMQ